MKSKNFLWFILILVSAQAFSPIALASLRSRAMERQDSLPSEKLISNNFSNLLKGVLAGIEIYRLWVESKKNEGQRPKKLQFPLDTCGDLAPKTFPAIRYRVQVNYSEEALTIIRQKLCKDAWPMTNKGKRVIVITSFSEQNLSTANKFAAALGDHFPGTKVERVVIKELVD
jgi:hypothetical protein